MCLKFVLDEWKTVQPWKATSDLGLHSLHRPVSAQILRIKMLRFKHYFVEYIKMCWDKASMKIILHLEFKPFLSSNRDDQLDRWAIPWENAPSDMCAKQKVKTVCTPAKSDLSYHWAFFRQPRKQYSFMWTAQTLIRLRRYANFYETSLDVSVWRYVLSHYSSNNFIFVYFSLSHLLHAHAHIHAHMHAHPSDPYNMYHSPCQS